MRNQKSESRRQDCGPLTPNSGLVTPNSELRTLEMTHRAIDRNAFCLVTIEAKAHGHIHRAHGDSCLSHVSVANLAVHARADVRRMIELDVRQRAVTIYSLPRDFLISLEVRGHFFNFGFVSGDDLVTGHTDLDTWDSCVRSRIHSHMTIGTMHPNFYKVDFVCVRNRLHRFGAPVEKIAQGIGQCRVSRSERAGSRARFLRIVLSSGAVVEASAL